MKIKQYIILLFLSLAALQTKGQDLHFTLFDYAPAVLNPALAGAYNGTGRVGALYRGQWSDFGGPKVPTLFVDAPLIRGLRKTDWVGVAFSGNSQNGSLTGSGVDNNLGEVSMSGGTIGVAYHMGFGKDYKTVFTIGAQYGKSTGMVTAVLPSNLEAGIGAPLPIEGASDASFTDLNVGLLLKSRLSKKSSFMAGINLKHLNNPYVGYFASETGSNSDRVGIRMNIHAELSQLLSPRLRFDPSVYFYSTDANPVFNVQSRFGYLINPKKQLVLIGGLGYRVGDALQLIVGAEVKDLRVAAAFDMTAGGVQNGSGLQNAFELGVNYILKIYKKQKTTPVRFCPRF